MRCAASGSPRLARRSGRTVHGIAGPLLRCRFARSIAWLGGQRSPHFDHLALGVTQRTARKAGPAELRFELLPRTRNFAEQLFADEMAVECNARVTALDPHDAAAYPQIVALEDCSRSL